MKAMPIENPAQTLMSQDDGFEHTSPLGCFPLGASLYGVMDMAGNIWEWIADW
jgi:formylglycine-generating enzyme required for sulfatase activity